MVDFFSKVNNFFYGNLSKNKQIKIVVIGNCQSRPIARCLSLLNSNIVITSIAVVHLLKSEQIDEYEKYFEEADYIVAQLVADDYHCEFVRTCELKKKYAFKLVSIVNLYYQGYNPELMYLRNTSQGTLKSPLGEYHNKTIVDSWKKSLSIEECLNLCNDFEYNQQMYSGIAEKSINELKNREKSADVLIADLIDKELVSRRLFFVFNHPSIWLIKEMCIRILEKLDIEIPHKNKTLNIPELLDKIIVPVNIYAKESLGLSFEDVYDFQGVGCKIDAKGDVTTYGQHRYTFEELVKKYYEIYDKALAS
ncbi:MAG: hypothetical protein QG567_937 [Campylobacterota bacterium]|nr:hypothetical protein [Campylobacterota bacterium]